MTNNPEAPRLEAVKHTPLPWKADVRVGVVQVYAGDNRRCLATNAPVVFQIDGKWNESAGAWEIDPLAEANAAFIVEACNNYERVLAELNTRPVHQDAQEVREDEAAEFEKWYLSPMDAGNEWGSMVDKETQKRIYFEGYRHGVQRGRREWDTKFRLVSETYAALAATQTKGEIG